MRFRRYLPQLLHEASFRRYWSGQTISLFGDQITYIAMPLTAVLVLHAGAQVMGFLTAASWLPSLLIGIHAGAWVDRRGRRRQIMMIADLARALLLFGIPVAALLGVLNIPFLLADVFFIGIFSVLFNVSSGTLFASMVPQDRYVEANSLLHGSRAVSFMAGPGIGGALVQLLTAPAALIADAFSFLASAASLARIHPEEPPPVKAGRGHTSAGLRFIWTKPLLRTSLAAVTTINLFNFVFNALFVLYASRELEIQPGMLGLIMGAGAVGSLLGAAAANKISKRIGLGFSMLAGAVLFPAPLLLVPLAEGPHALVLAFLFLAECFAGLGVMILDISYGAVLTAAVPDALRARVTGAFGFINYGIRPLGALIGGALPGWIGLHGTLWVGAVGGCLGFLWLLPSPFIRLREVKDFAAGGSAASAAGQTDTSA